MLKLEWEVISTDTVEHKERFREVRVTVFAKLTTALAFFHENLGNFGDKAVPEPGDEAVPRAPCTPQGPSRL